MRQLLEGLHHVSAGQELHGALMLRCLIVKR